MPEESRTVRYDPELNIEAYRLHGVLQGFPSHFHDYYAIGYLRQGRRNLAANGGEYLLMAGDIVLFNPGDVHSCGMPAGKAMDYQCINIKQDVMLKISGEITGHAVLPRFSVPVIHGSELTPSLGELCDAVETGSKEFQKEELFFFLMEQLIRDYSEAWVSKDRGEPAAGLDLVCDYLKANYCKAVTLDGLSAMAGLSKYHFLRSFTREKGISPYSYLVTLRIGGAKKLLENGVPPLEAAMQTGFSDQSHFTNFFKRFIGLTPKQYMRIFAKDREAQRKPSKEDTPWNTGEPRRPAI